MDNRPWLSWIDTLEALTTPDSPPAAILADCLDVCFRDPDWDTNPDETHLYKFLARCWPYPPLRLRIEAATQYWSKERRALLAQCVTPHLVATPPQSSPRTEMTAAELLAQDFAPIAWFAEGLLHEGMVLFGGKSKRGKSWVMLNLAAAIASGGIAFGHYQVPIQQKVLYCALEDGPRRMQRRLRMIDPAGDADYSNLKFAFSVPPLSEGGIDYLTQHILDGYKLIVVDVLAHLEKAGKNGLRDYHEVYETFAPLQQLRSDHAFALVMVTHLRKAESEEVFDNLHGSVAYQGAQDALWVLERKPGNDTANLHLRDKDAEDKVIELKFDGGGLWSFVGEGEEYISSKKQEEVLTFMREEGRPLAIKEIMLGLGISQQEYEAFRKRIMRMAGTGLLVRLDRGKYGVLHSNDFEMPY